MFEARVPARQFKRYVCHTPLDVREQAIEEAVDMEMKAATVRIEGD
jgi:hypothetical protein